MSHESARGIFKFNPLDPIPGIKGGEKTVAVASSEHVKALLDWSAENQSELIPFFVLGFFAGLRPDSELALIEFERINFEL